MSAGSRMVWYRLTPAYDPRRFYKDIRLYFLIRGGAKLTLYGKEEALGPGDLLLVGSFREETVRLLEDTMAAVFVIPEKAVSDYVDLFQTSFVCDSRKKDHRPYAALQIYLKKSLSLSADTSPLGRLKRVECDCQVLECLLEHFTLPVPHGKLLSREDREEYIQRYIHNNYRRQFTLQELSDRLGLSLPYLSKYIKNRMGCGFNTYVNRLRLQYTMEEMERGEKSFLKAAVNHGFANMASFQRTFQDVYGMMPSAYKINRERQETKQGEEQEEERKLAETVKASLPRDQLESRQIWQEKEEKSVIKADTARREPCENNWLEVLNLGEAEDLLRGDVQEHIIRLKKNLGFKYGRIRGLFSPKLFVDINAREGFNFSRLDRVLDFLVRNHIIPFCDMGFKEAQLQTNAGQVPLKIWERAEEFSDIGQYEKLIRQFLRYCIRRYGENQVEQWKFELNWYVTDSWQGMAQICRNIFTILYQAIKEYSPGSQIGGFGFNVYDSNRLIKDYLKYSKKDRIHPDFISVLLYPYERREGENPLIRDPDYVEKELAVLLKLLKDYGYTRDQLYVTEWNLSVSVTNFLHDSCYKGAWILRNTAASLGRIRVMAHWGNTDRTADFFDAVRLLNGRNGLISRSGICKPSYYAYEFLNSLEKYLISKGPNHIVTAGGDGNYTIVCNNWVPLKDAYYREYKEDIPSSQMASMFGTARRSLEFVLSGVPGGRYKVEKLFVSRYAGSVFDEWLRVGSPEDYGKLEEEYLSAVCVPHFQTYYAESLEGCLTIETSMAADEIQLLHIFLDTFLDTGEGDHP